MPRIIEVTVSPRGETTIRTRDYTGAECLQASRSLEQSLGLTAAERKTAEFYQQQTASRVLSPRRGAR